MTTHRTIQLSNLLDTLTSKSRVCRSGSENLARIGNLKGSAFQLDRALRFQRLADKVSARLNYADTIQKAIDSWNNSAREEETWAKWQEDHGLPYGSVRSSYVRADSYRRTAQALAILLDTGKNVCNRCFSPYDYSLPRPVEMHSCGKVAVQ